MEKVPPCTVGKRHKWVWKKDVTTTQLTVAENRATRKGWRRGIYECACGQRKEGDAKSKL